MNRGRRVISFPRPSGIDYGTNSSYPGWLDSRRAEVRCRRLTSVGARPLSMRAIEAEPSTVAGSRGHYDDDDKDHHHHHHRRHHHHDDHDGTGNHQSLGYVNE